MTEWTENADEGGRDGRSHESHGRIGRQPLKLWTEGKPHLLAIAWNNFRR
jgi:hypothetical protein